MKQNHLNVPSLFETLEERRLFAAISLNSGVMNLTGSTNQTNKLAISVDSSGRIWGVADNYASSYLSSQTSGININEGSTNDQYTIAANLPVAVRIINPSGALVQTISAGSAAVSSSSSNTNTSTTVDPTAPVAKITTDSATVILTGQSVFVDGLTSTLNSGTDLTTKYQWDFGDPGSQYNQLVGFNAGHAYETAGTYTITLTVTNSLGKISSATQTVFVNADTRGAIYVNSVTGSDSNNGTTAGTAIKSLTKLNQIIQPNEDIFFARGDTFAATAWVNAQSSDTFDAYGTGASPVLQWQGATTSNNVIIMADSSTMKDVVVQNLTFDTLNPTTNAPDAIEVGGTDVTVRNDTFLNVGDCVNANGNPDGLLVQGNSQPLLTGMLGYMVWFQGEDGVIVGNTSVNSVGQHNIRASDGFSRLLIENNNLQNVGASVSGVASDYSKSCINTQYGSNIYINSNTVTDGNIRIGPLDGVEIDSYPLTALAERETNVVVEDNTINASDIEVHPGTVDAIVRNNVVSLDNAAGIDIYAYDPTYNNIVQDVSFLNNTVINNGTNGNAFWVMGETSGVVIANNLYIAPNFEPGYYTDTSPIYVDYVNLSGLTISNNIWPEPTLAQRTWWANGGVNYMTTDLGQDGFYTEAAWNALPGVNHDIFSTVPLNVGDQATISGVTAGANLAVAG